MEFIVTIEKIEDINLFCEAGATVLLFCDEFHGTRAPFKFKQEELIEAFRKTQELGLKVAVYMNRIYTDKELDQAEEYMKFLKEHGVAFIYYNDPAVYILAESLGLVGHLVYEPDTLMTNSRDMQFVLDQGIHHAVLSTEITLDEMKEMCINVHGNTEAILFGYLNMSYSKRHLIQNYCDEIGADNTCVNKMNCVLIESTREGKMPILEDEQGTHIFTDYILDAFDEFKVLKDTGLKSMRIDGIFLPRDLVVDACKAFVMIDLGMDSEVIRKKFEEKYSEYPFSKGYMYQKTNLVK